MSNTSTTAFHMADIRDKRSTARRAVAIGELAVGPVAAERRVLAAPLIASVVLPPFDNCAMDSSGLQAKSSGAEFAVRGWQAAGDAQCATGEGAREVMTGVPLPAGLDAVIPVKQVQMLAQADGRPTAIRQLAEVRAGQHVRRRDEVIAVGDRLLAEGECLRVQHSMLLAAMCAAWVSVRRRPRVAVIATGRELVADPAQALSSGQIRAIGRPQRPGASLAADG